MSHAPAVETEAVASGSFAQIERWAELLRKAKVRFEVRCFCDEHRVNRLDRAELWVDRRDVDRARSCIRGAHDADKSLLW
jgi:hypothetical protein